MRIRGTIRSADGISYTGGGILVRFFNLKTVAGHVYTIGLTLKDNIKTLVRSAVSFPNLVNRGIHYYTDTNNKIRMVFTSGNMNANPISFLVIPKAGKDVPFDFTISDVFMYEGAYTNPPLYVSLDVNPNMSILYKDRLYEKQYGSFPSISTGATIGWQRIYEIPCVKNNGVNFTRTNFEGILQIGKEYNASINSFTEVKFGVAKDGGDTYAFLEADAYGAGSVATGTTYPFSQFRISRNPTTGVFYLDGYHANSASNGVWFNLSDWSFMGRDRTWHLYEIMSNPTNNSYIKSFNEVQVGDFHYKEAIPSGIESVLTKTITLKMAKI